MEDSGRDIPYVTILSLLEMMIIWYLGVEAVVIILHFMVCLRRRRRRRRRRIIIIMNLSINTYPE